MSESAQWRLKLARRGERRPEFGATLLAPFTCLLARGLLRTSRPAVPMLIVGPLFMVLLCLFSSPSHAVILREKSGIRKKFSEQASANKSRAMKSGHCAAK